MVFTLSLDWVDLVTNLENGLCSLSRCCHIEPSPVSFSIFVYRANHPSNRLVRRALDTTRLLRTIGLAVCFVLARPMLGPTYVVSVRCSLLLIRAYKGGNSRPNRAVGTFRKIVQFRRREQCVDVSLCFISS